VQGPNRKPTTEVIRIDPLDPDPAALAHAADLIGSGSVIAFPTDTVYGLACRPDDPKAIDAVYDIKGRPRRLPLVLFIPAVDELARYAADTTVELERATRRFWPGPLTAVVRAGDRVPPAVAADGTVGVRVPRHPIALGLVRAVGGALATTSANLSGRGSIADPAQVLEQLGGRIVLLLDAGQAPGGMESTVVDFTQQPPVVLRAGAIGIDDLRSVIGPVEPA
jgi:L-threonylcarbamoyladenylate synthase